MLRELRLLFSAIQFFTRLPLPAWVGHDAQQLDQTARYLPLVGILVGTIAAFVLWLGSMALPLSLAIGLSMVASILVTGAFHEDGLADFADGFGGGHNREQVLAIMKDSRVGSYGVLALVLVLLLKYQALLALCGAYGLPYAAAALVAAHSVSRLLAASLMFTQHYVRADDTARARPAAQQLSGGSLAIALLTACAALGLLVAAGARGLPLLSALAAALLLRAWLARRTRQRLGGYTGDCLGALQQLGELAFYLGLAAAL